MKKILMFLIFVFILSSSALAQDLTDTDCGIALNESSILTENMTCSGTGIFIARDGTTLDCDGHSITYAQGGSGMGVNITEFEGVIVKNCEIIEDNSGNNNYGIYVNYSSGFCPLGTCGNPSGGISLDISTVRIENNDIITSGAGSYDIGLFNADLVKLYNQNIGKYKIVNSRIRISDGIPGLWFNGKGLISFDDDVTETGINLSSDIIIEENLLKINSAKRGFNKTTRVKFYGVPICGVGEAVYRDSSYCGGSICNDLTVEGSGTGMYMKNYTFNVSSLIGGNAFTNYSIGATAVPTNGSCNPGPGLVELICGGTMNETLVPDASGRLNVTNSLNCNGQGVYFEISNILLDFKNNNISYGNSSTTNINAFLTIGGTSNFTMNNFLFIEPLTIGAERSTVEIIGEGMIHTPEDITLINFQIANNLADGIKLNNTEDISLINGSINITQNGTSIYLQNSEGAWIENLELIHAKYDLKIINSQVSLKNQSILNYTFTNANITVINDYGKIKFNELITENGESLDNDIQISNNFVYVNSGGSEGLNVSAEVTLYGVHIDRGEARILKNGEVCTDCGSLVREGNDFTFTVTGFSDYTIDSSMCGWYVNESSVLNESLNCSKTGLIINSSNIVLDCDGFNITYGNSGLWNTYGVHNDGFDNVTIKNCGIYEGNNIGNGKHGIYLISGLNNILNNNFINMTSNNSYAIFISESKSNYISNNILNTLGKWSDGIYLWDTNNTQIENNLISSKGSLSNGIYFEHWCNNNTIQDNNITDFYNAIYLNNNYRDGGHVRNIIIENNSMNNINNFELLLEWGVTNVSLINQIINEYDIFSTNIKLKTEYGELNFQEEYIEESGITLIIAPKQGDINILLNEIYVNSSKSGFNQSAQLSFYNTGLSGNIRAIRNNELCEDYCSNLTQDGDNYSYNVTGFTRYGLTTDAFCDEIIDWDLNQTRNLVCSGNAWHIGADNIVIDCQGHNITYGNSSFGYGINNSGYDNVTIKNCNFIEGSGSGDSKHAIYLNDTLGSRIINNTIMTTSTGYGINIEKSRINQIENNTITTIGGACYGIFGGHITNLSVNNNIINTQGDGYESTAVKIEESLNVLIEENTLTTSGNNAMGLRIYEVDNSELKDNFITTTGTQSVTLYVESSDNNIIINNTVEMSDGASAIYIFGRANNNLFENNTVTHAIRGIHFFGEYGDYPDNNTVKNNDFQTITQRDIVVGEDVTNLWLIDQNIERYYIESSDVNFKNDYGIIDYVEQVSGIGENLNEDVFIEQNNIVSSPSGFNKPADLTIYNIITLTIPEVKKDGLKCGDCSNLFTSNYSDTTKTYEFTIEGFSNYSMGEWSIGCEDTININFNYSNDLICDNTAWHIGADNLIIDCQGHNITYGNSGFGYGVNNTGYDNITVKNCNFIEGIGSGNNKHAMYYSNTKNSNIFNNTITTTNTGYGINIEKSPNMIIENNTINALNDDCYGIFGENVDNLIVKKNYINTLGENYESTAVKIEESLNVLIEKNTLTTSGNNAHGLMIYDVDSSDLKNNEINVQGISIYVENSDDDIIFNNTIELSDGVSAVYVYRSSNNNLIENNTFEQSKVGIEFEGNIGDYPDNNTLKNNDFQTITQRDIVVGEDVTNLWLIDQDIERYFIESSDVNFKNDYGIIDYVEQVSGTGDNLDEDVFIEQNNIVSSPSGFDKPANLTIYNITILGTAETKMNGETCENQCGNLTSFNCNGSVCDYGFNVTGFSNYSVGEMGLDCGDYVNSSVVLIYNLSCVGEGLNVGKDNVEINCQGHKITHGDNGINVNGKNNITIKNCILIESDEGYGVYYNNSDNGLIFNNTIQTVSNSSYGVYLENSWNNNITQNILNTTSSFSMYLDYSDNVGIDNNTLYGNQSIRIIDSNDVNIIRQNILGYEFDDSTINLKNINYGKILFNEKLNTSGNNLSEDIRIENNLIYVNSSKTGLNKSANIELYNLNFNGTVNVLKSGESCVNCSIVNYNNGVYLFNVTGFSNYSLVGMPVNCGQTIYNTLHLNESLECNGTAIYLGADNVEINCQSKNITYSNSNFGYGINISGYDNFTIKNCNIFEEFNGSQGIYIDGNNGEIYNNQIKVINENSSAIYFNSADNLDVWNNTLNSTDVNSYVVYLLDSNSNEFENNTISEGGKGILVLDSDLNEFKNNTIENIDNVELKLSNSSYNLFLYQEVEDYELQGIVYFENNYGKIEFLEELNQSGTNLSQDVLIEYNVIQVNDSQIGLNKSANLTFYNMTQFSGFVFPTLNGKEQGDWCPGNICNEFKKNNWDFSFSVTGFSNYSLFNLTESGPLQIEGEIILGGDLTSGNMVGISNDYVVLDCNHYTVYYGGGTSEIAINNTGYDNVTIKNCNFEPHEDFENGNMDLIYFYNAEDGTIRNNTFPENTTGDQINILLNKSNRTSLIDQNANQYIFSDSLIEFETNYGKIAYTSDLTQNGSNLSSDILINENLISVDSNKIGFNNNADLSFYNLNIQGIAYAKRNNESCGSYCNNISNSGNNYFFSVTGFSNYSIGENISSENDGDNPIVPPSTGAGGFNFGSDISVPNIGSPYPTGIIYLYNDTLSLKPIPSISVVTNEPSTCRWSFNDKEYGRMENTFRSLGNIHTWESVENWKVGTYMIYVRCIDAVRNTNPSSYSWDFEIVEGGSDCGNDICEYGEDENNCPEDCGIGFSENLINKENSKSSDDLTGRAYSIIDLIQNTELGSWLVYILIFIIFLGGYFISHHTTGILFKTKSKKKVEDNLEELKPEIALSAKKIKYRLVNGDVYNASLEYLNLKRLYLKIPNKYTKEKKYLYKYIMKIYKMIKEATEDEDN